MNTVYSLCPIRYIIYVIPHASHIIVHLACHTIHVLFWPKSTLFFLISLSSTKKSKWRSGKWAKNFQMVTFCCCIFHHSCSCALLLTLTNVYNMGNLELVLFLYILVQKTCSYVRFLAKFRKPYEFDRSGFDPFVTIFHGKMMF